MLLSMVRFPRILLLAGFAAGIAQPGIAQNDTPVQTFAPALTDSSSNAPVTTLSIDLLAPQRAFTYDATGASLSSSALDPTLRTEVYGAVGQTDTGVRDSSQAGQVSPYDPGGSRLSTLFSGSGTASRSSSVLTPGFIDQPASPQSDMDYGQPYGTEIAAASAIRDESYRSTWGSSSAISLSTSNGSWGAHSAAPSHSGAGTGGQTSSLASGYQSGSDLSSTQSEASLDDPYRARPIPNIGWKSPGLARSRPNARVVPPTTFGAGSTERFISRPGQVPGQDPYSSTAGQAATQSSGETPFHALGDSSSSPFGDFGQRDFLHPNILSAFSASSSTRTSSASPGHLRYGLAASNSRLHSSISTHGVVGDSFSAPSSRSQATPKSASDRAASVH